MSNYFSTGTIPLLQGSCTITNYEERFGRNYITFGPAGASFHKDGPGNVEYILWVTMREDGSRVAWITLEGIYDRKGRELQLKDMCDRFQEKQ